MIGYLKTNLNSIQIVTISNQTLSNQKLSREALILYFYSQLVDITRFWKAMIELHQCQSINKNNVKATKNRTIHLNSNLVLKITGGMEGLASIE